MYQLTSNLKLKKPSYTHYANIHIINENMDIVDESIGQINRDQSNLENSIKGKADKFDVVNSINGKKGVVSLSASNLDYNSSNTIKEEIDKKSNKYDVDREISALKRNKADKDNVVTSINDQQGRVKLDASNLEYNKHSTIKEEIDRKANSSHTHDDKADKSDITKLEEDKADKSDTNYKLNWLKNNKADKVLVDEDNGNKFELIFKNNIPYFRYNK